MESAAHVRTNSERPRATGTNPAADPQQWLDDHGDALFAYALARVKKQDVAEDLVQETLLGGLRTFDRFKGDSTVRTWLVAILRHKILNHYRARSKAPVELDALLGPETTDAQFSRSGKWRKEANPKAWDSAGEQAEFGSALQLCLDQLPPRVAEAFLLGEQNECSAAEISKMLDITATNVYVMRHRARAALRRCLEERWLGDSPHDSVRSEAG